MLTLYGAFPEEFDPAATPFFIEIDGLDVPFYCSRFERRGQTGAVAAFEDMDNERRASELLGREFRIETASEEEDDDEFYLEDLVGFAAEVQEVAASDALCAAGDCGAAPQDAGRRTAEAPAGAGVPEPGVCRGEVVDFYDNGANPLFELELDGRRVLVPAVEEFIARIDFEERTMKFVLPAGLVALQS